MTDTTIPLDEYKRRQASNEPLPDAFMSKGRVAQNVEARARQSGMFYASSLQGKTPKPRKWVVDGLVPDNAVTLFSGNGAVGKSILALQLVAASATGKQWIGKDVKKCRSMFLSAEDDKDEMHRRLDRINDHYRVEPADYEAELILWDKTSDATPFLFRNQEGWEESPFFCLLHQFVVDTGIELLVIDSMYNFFSGNELNRVDAATFMDCLQKLALEAECAIVVLWHPSASGLESGTGTSGSTAFRNRARQMLYMTRPKEDADDYDPDIRALKIVKSNYGQNDIEYKLRFGEGVLLPDEPEQTGFLGQIDRNNKLAAAKDVFLKCLDIATAQGRSVTDATNTPRYAPKAFSRMPECGGISAKNLAEAMEHLFSEKTIRIGTAYNDRRQAISAIVRCEK